MNCTYEETPVCTHGSSEYDGESFATVTWWNGEIDLNELIRKVELWLVEEGQHDPKFKLGETIKYTPHEVADILRKHLNV